MPETTGNTSLSTVKDADFYIRFFRNDNGTFVTVKSDTLERFVRQITGGRVMDAYQIPSENGQVISIPLYNINGGTMELPQILQLSTSSYGKYLPYVLRSPNLAEGITFQWSAPLRTHRARELAEEIKQYAVESIGEFIRPFEISVTINERIPRVTGTVIDSITEESE